MQRLLGYKKQKFKQIKQSAFTQLLHKCRFNYKVAGGWQSGYKTGRNGYYVGRAGQQNDAHDLETCFTSCAHKTKLWFFKTWSFKTWLCGSLLTSVQNLVRLRWKTCFVASLSESQTSLQQKQPSQIKPKGFKCWEVQPKCLHIRTGVAAVWRAGAENNVPYTRVKVAPDD